MNLKTLTLLAALSGSSVAAFAAPSLNVSLDVQSTPVRYDERRDHRRDYDRRDRRHRHDYDRHHDDRILRYAPPPLRHEYRGHRPHRHAVWVSGYWSHHRGRHVWVPGHWARIPRGRHAWVQPRWERRHGGYIYIDGYWR
jgi:hypothetical protein